MPLLSAQRTTLCLNQLCNTCLTLSLLPLPAPTPLGSYRSEQSFCFSLPGFYGHFQGSREDVWGPNPRWINFLLYIIQLFLVLLHTFEARGGPQGEAGGPRGRVPDFSLCPLHLLPGRHQQRGGRTLLQGPQQLHGWRGQTAAIRTTGHRYTADTEVMQKTLLWLMQT